MKFYKAVYADEEFETFYEEDDNKAYDEAEKYENEHGIIFNLYEIDEDYNEIRTIY